MQLHQGQHVTCNENKLQIISKGTSVEHTTKTGFVLGPNIWSSDTNACTKETNRKMKLDDGIVEIKKEFICEKDARSKVLSIHVASSHSKKIDEMLKELKN